MYQESMVNADNKKGAVLLDTMIGLTIFFIFALAILTVLSNVSHLHKSSAETEAIAEICHEEMLLVKKNGYDAAVPGKSRHTAEKDNLLAEVTLEIHQKDETWKIVKISAVSLKNNNVHCVVALCLRRSS